MTRRDRSILLRGALTILLGAASAGCDHCNESDTCVTDDQLCSAHTAFCCEGLACNGESGRCEPDIDARVIDAPTIDAPVDAAMIDPAAGWVTLSVNGSNLAAAGAAKLDLPPAEAAKPAAYYEWFFTGVPLGSCAVAPQLGAEFAAAADVGPTMELRNGPTVVMTLLHRGNGLYGNGGDGSAVSTGASLDLAAPGATTIVPTVIPGVVVMGGRTRLTAPLANAVVTRGQPLLVTWTPPAGPPPGTTMIYNLSTNLIGCHVDPMAGSFTIPGPVTMMFQGTSIVMDSMNRRFGPVMINGAARTVLGIGQWRDTVPIRLSGGG